MDIAPSARAEHPDAARADRRRLRDQGHEQKPDTPEEELEPNFARGISEEPARAPSSHGPLQRGPGGAARHAGEERRAALQRGHRAEPDQRLGRGGAAGRARPRRAARASAARRGQHGAGRARAGRRTACRPAAAGPSTCGGPSRRLAASGARCRRRAARRRRSARGTAPTSAGLSPRRWRSIRRSPSARRALARDAERARLQREHVRRAGGDRLGDRDRRDHPAVEVAAPVDLDRRPARPRHPARGEERGPTPRSCVRIPCRSTRRRRSRRRPRCSAAPTSPLVTRSWPGRRRAAVTIVEHVVDVDAPACRAARAAGSRTSATRAARSRRRPRALARRRRAAPRR